jgi:hypothetical protein
MITGQDVMVDTLESKHIRRVALRVKVDSMILRTRQRDSQPVARTCVKFASHGRGVFTSVVDLRSKLIKYIRAYRNFARPIRWTYTDSKHLSALNQ